MSEKGPDAGKYLTISTLFLLTACTSFNGISQLPNGEKKASVDLYWCSGII